MLSLAVVLLSLGHAAPQPVIVADDSAGFVTVLGRDTIALESFSRTASRLQGDILLRIPGTVLFHYLIDTRPDGSVSHSAVRLTPMGAPDLAPRIVTLDFVHGTVRAVVDSAGSTRRATFEAPPSATPILTTGFNDSFGLYASFGMYELLLTGPSFRLTDSVTAPAVGALTGELGSKRFARRSPTQVDVDYFGMAWTHLVVSGDGRIQSADGMETTEKTRTQRTGPVDVVRAAKKFAARDRDGKGLGIASPRGTVRTMLGPAHIAIDYSSPRKRGRTILGSVVPYGQVWRTGANAATTLYIDRPLTVGTVALPVGGYSLYTLPQADGVQLIINRQVGQWGTEYDASQDLARLPMRISVSATPREEFAITVTGQGDTGELRIQWDTFVWTVPLKVQ